MLGRTPIVGISLGDPAGIGAEVTLKALATEPRPAAAFVLFGHPRSLELAAACSGHEAFAAALPEWDPFGDQRLAGVFRQTVDAAWPEPFELGRYSVAGGALQRESLEAALDELVSHRIDALVTAPVNKAIFADEAEIHGQSELLAKRSATSEWAMMLTGPRLSVVLVTTHIPLHAVAQSLSVEAIVEKARVTTRFFERFHGKRPRIALAALNPHAGEGGLVGDEEQRLLEPAIAAANAEGIALRGPYPADSLFVSAVRGEHDVVLCLYHDQGLIPLKLLHFDEAVNVTIGPDVIRTSPDHGVAYDIAGRGIADPRSMRAAIDYALACAARVAGTDASR